MATFKLIFGKEFLTVLEGFGFTLLITIGAFAIGLVLGTLVAVVKMSPSKNPIVVALRWLANAYVAVFRGTPIVVQLLLIYFAMLMPMMIPNWLCAIIIFGLNSGAYVSEIMRAGILSIDKGQMEAGRALGMNYTITMGKIIVPQAIKNMIPTLSNELVSLTKETSVAGYVAVADITFVIQRIAASTYDYFAAYLILAVIYFLFVSLLTYGIRCMERRLRKSDKR
ncbi:MAG: amino acid ABC transporter permease [Clostridia bacterium]